MTAKMKNTVLVIFLLVWLFPACSPLITPKTSLTPITVQLRWTHQAQFAGMYAADLQGYFAEQGLAVTFLEGMPTTDFIGVVLDDKAQFGITNADSLIIARSQGKPVTAIATIYQRSPSVFITLANSGITRPQDFIGKRISVLGVQELEIQLHDMLDFLGLDHDAVILTQHSYDYDQLVSGGVDVQAYYATGGLQRLQDAGIEVNLIYPGDYGVHHTGDCIAVSDAFLDQNPDLAVRFLRAFTRGWRYTIEHQDQALQATMRYALESDPDLQRSMLTATIPLISTGSHQIGSIDTRAWQSLHDALLDQKHISQSIPLEQMIDPSFIERASSE